jgi:hypothetical protein
LNKKVGDYDSGWNHRHAYVRIYDPRNFEFEISIENLLYILENTSAIKGKGLEGDFVYGWDGKDLILIPTESPDYVSMNEYNNILHNNETIKAKDLIIGATYLTKDNCEMIYMGRYDYFSSGYRWIERGEYKTSKSSRDIPSEQGRYRMRSVDYKYINNYPYGKHFWFAYKYHDYDYINGERVPRTEFKWHFNQYKSISGKFIKCVDDNCAPEYADIFEILEGNKDYSPYDETQSKIMKMSIDDFIKLGKSMYSDKPDYYSSFKFISERSGVRETYLADPNNYSSNEYHLKKFNPRNEENGYCYGYQVGFENVYGFSNMSLEELYDATKPIYEQKYLKNGREYEKGYTV